MGKKYFIIKEIFETYGFFDIELASDDLEDPKFKKLMTKWGIKMMDTKKGDKYFPVIRFWGNHYSLVKLMTSPPLSQGKKSDDMEFFEYRYIPQESPMFEPYPKIS